MGMGRMSHSYVRNQWEEKIESKEKQNHEHHHKVVAQPLGLKKGCHPAASDGESTERVDPTVDDPVVVPGQEIGKRSMDDISYKPLIEEKYKSK